MNNEKEIPFGVFDSELMHQEISIPEGFEATTEGNKIILKKIESEDERIRKELIGYFTGWSDKHLFRGFKAEQILTWLEKQGEHKKFRDSIQVGDEVTRNRDGVIVNLSQLNRVAKKDEKQSETFTKRDVDNAFVEGMAFAKNELEKQKPADKVETKFKVKYAGREYNVLEIKEIAGVTYYGIEDEPNHIDWLINVEVIDAEKKELKKIEFSDVGHEYYSELLKNDKSDNIADYAYQCAYCMSHDWAIENPTWDNVQSACRLGAKWQKKHDVSEEVNGEDYGIDGIWHAQRILEKTLGSVDGYQSDDGILDHRAAITAVKKLHKQKSEWSEEDEEHINYLIDVFDGQQYHQAHSDEELVNWLKSLKQRYFWKPSDKQMEVLVWCLPLFVDPKSKSILESLINELKKLRKK